ncbi:hypothetical protein TRFO_31524 [Tritrichomonas foetus]|uniref:Uncharacterized protein n=1 Tax=Tritrichomonas foetus TaxID=1144522 RepID=A0A1J4JR38_9EUKA|nr:hypothetical protein TRFO_31524 [Tritrichomonas foetus]|eukprot:OHT01639.1 hypothetical protein TRFO_31524 [Tritrichomonas foetus]
MIYKTPLDLATLSGDQDLVNAIQEKMKNITVPYEEKIREERRKIKEKKIQEKLEKEKEVKQNEDLAMDELFS